MLFFIFLSKHNSISISISGELKLQHGLDYESQTGSSLFNLVIVAKEHSRDPLESRATVAVSVANENDNAPEFTSFAYAPARPVSEDLGIGTTILTVTATDKDCGQLGKCAGGVLTYSIVDNPTTTSTGLNCWLDLFHSQIPSLNLKDIATIFYHIRVFLVIVPYVQTQSSLKTIYEN